MYALWHVVWMMRMGGDYRWASEMPRSRHGSTRGSRPALRPPRAVSITPRCEGGKIKGGVRHGAVGFGAALQLSDDGARIQGRVAKEGGGAGAVAPRALGLVGRAERVEQVLHHRSHSSILRFPHPLQFFRNIQRLCF